MRVQIKTLLLAAVLVLGLSVSAGAKQFNDVPAGHWAEAEINSCVEYGILNGQSDTWFGLGTPMYRSAFTVALCRLMGWEAETPDDLPYTDVPTDAWYAGAVQAAYHHGAITRQRTVFRPLEPVTREEMTVMLMRALGYTTIAGQETEIPFRDVSTNSGYLAMAYRLGLMNGISATEFAPAGTATREHAAAIFARMYRKLHGAPLEKIGIISSETQAKDLKDFHVGILEAAQMMNGRVDKTIAEDGAERFRETLHRNGSRAMLQVKLSSTALNGTPQQAAGELAKAAGSYDGLVLEISAVPAKSRTALTEMLQQLRPLLADKPLWVRGGEGWSGEALSGLAALADELILELPDPGAEVAPADAPEVLYQKVVAWKQAIPAEKLAVLLKGTGEKWINGKPSGTLTAAQVAKLPNTNRYYSDRYASTYIDEGENTVTWIPDGRGAAARAQLMKLLGVTSVALRNPGTVPQEYLAGLK